MKHPPKNPAFKRSERIGDQITRELARAFIDRVSDPRFARCTLTSVEVSDDLRHARVFFSTLDSDEKTILDLQVALQRAAGYFKRILGNNLRLRYTPELKFIYDKSLDQGAKMIALIEKVRSSDESDD